MEQGYTPENEIGPQRIWGDYVSAILKATGGEEEDMHGNVVAFSEPLITGVRAAGSLIEKMGKKVNVKIIGDSQGGFRIKVRPAWPNSKQERSFIISPKSSGYDKPPEVITELTEYLGWIAKPREFEDDYTKRKDIPDVRVIEEPRPVTVAEETEFIDFIESVADRSEKLGLNKLK